MQVLAGQDIDVNSRKAIGQMPKIPHECRSFSYESVTSASKRQFLFRDVALEIFLADGRNYLITTMNKQRDTIHKRLLERTTLGDTEELSRKDTVATINSFGAKLLNVFTMSPAAQAAARWEKREISNFEYLMILNSLAGRSYNDLTQYPVMPWVLADYSSATLDLNNPASFRDLSKNMGSQYPERKRDFEERYESFAAAGIHDTRPFHFGTHYSSAMIVCSYLIRVVPFVDSYLLLQGGHFDHPDRLFYSIKKAWLSASRDNMTDVRELTPEWFYLPEFLTNSNAFDFGTRQTSGEKIDDVELPPWAHGDPRIFIAKHREALESEYVSAHLHQWVDLIFGYKQLGSAAVEAVNVYHALSYHGAIDLDAVKDPVERLATIGIIHNFGQTPRQVFTKPHIVRGSPQRSISCSRQLDKIKLQSISGDIKQPVGEIILKEDLSGLPVGRIRSSLGPNINVIWGTTDNSLRVVNREGGTLTILPSLHSQRISHCLSCGDSIILGSEDTTLSVLKLVSDKTDHIMLQSQAYLRGHKTPVTAVTASSSFSVVLSGDEAGIVLTFDLNRLEFVRNLCVFNRPVAALAVNDLTGDSIACSSRVIKIHTVNGILLASTTIEEDDSDIVSAASFAENTFFTGHSNGLTIAWRLFINDTTVTAAHSSLWSLNLVSRLSCRTSASILAIKMTATRLFTGDSNGKIYSWGVGG